MLPQLPTALLAELALHWVHAPRDLARLECAAPEVLAATLAGARECLPADAAELPELPGTVERGCAEQTEWTEQRMRVQWEEPTLDIPLRFWCNSGHSFGGPPVITYWRMTYTRFTNFSIESSSDDAMPLMAHQMIVQTIGRAVRLASAADPFLKKNGDLVCTSCFQKGHTRRECPSRDCRWKACGGGSVAAACAEKFSLPCCSMTAMHRAGIG